MTERSTWPYWVCIVLASWLLASPFTMGYAGSTALRLNDLGSSLAILFLSALGLVSASRSHAIWVRWGLASVGLWMTFAPLVFWAADAASYSNGILVGTLVIIASVIVPSVLSDPVQTGGIPLGWTYNPSSWKQRTPIIGLAFLGFLMARYLSAFQLGHISSVWEPFFGRGTEKILTSKVSQWFPVSDAGLGAWSYLLDALSGALGGPRRWHKMPWVVVLFGIMIIPPGVTSITLVVLQPVAVSEWCTLCLATAVVMLAMVPPAIDEVVATLQMLVREKKSGRSLWLTFWRGTAESYEQEAPVLLPKKGGSLSAYLLFSAAICVWLMISPAVLGVREMAADVSYFLGAVLVTISVVSIAQVARPFRYVNCLFALSLAAVCWFMPGGSALFRINAIAVAIFIFALSLPLGPIRDRFGSYDRSIRWKPFAAKAAPIDRDERRAA